MFFDKPMAAQWQYYRCTKFVIYLLSGYTSDPRVSEHPLCGKDMMAHPSTDLVRNQGKTRRELLAAQGSKYNSSPFDPIKVQRDMMS